MLVFPVKSLVKHNFMKARNFSVFWIDSSQKRSASQGKVGQLFIRCIVLLRNLQKRFRISFLISEMNSGTEKTRTFSKDGIYSEKCNLTNKKIINLNILIYTLQHVYKEQKY